MTTQTPPDPARTGAHTLDSAKAQARQGHSYRGFCYIVLARDGGYYLTSEYRTGCRRGCVGNAHGEQCTRGDKVVTRFDRHGIEHPLRRRAAGDDGSAAISADVGKIRSGRGGETFYGLTVTLQTWDASPTSVPKAQTAALRRALVKAADAHAAFRAAVEQAAAIRREHDR
jgi:uncharacterized protein YdbL (DUF1318 family)